MKKLIYLTLLVLISCAKSHPGRFGTVPTPEPSPVARREELRSDPNQVVESVAQVKLQMSQNDYQTLTKKIAPTSFEKNFIYSIDTQNGHLDGHKLELTISDIDNKVSLIFTQELADTTTIKSVCTLSDLSLLVLVLNKPELLFQMDKKMCAAQSEKTVKHPLDLLKESSDLYKIDPTLLKITKKQIIKKNHFNIIHGESAIAFSINLTTSSIVPIELKCEIDLSDYFKKEEQVDACVVTFEKYLKEEFNLTVSKL